MNTLMLRILILFIQLFSSQQDEPLPTQITNRLATYSWNYPHEKVYIHTDKSNYVAGEDIWFKVYLMIGPYHIPDTLSTVLYIELIHMDGIIRDRKTIRVREGLGWGDFNLPSNIPHGNYIIRAYTRYMQNFDPAFFFRKIINILPVKKSTLTTPSVKAAVEKNADERPVRIQFFPEGGNLVAGLHNYIAFKATDQTGKGNDVEGIIENSKGTKITEFKSQKFGLGFFTLKPEAGEHYFAVVFLEDRKYYFELPQPMNKGYVMHIKKTEDNVYIWVRNNMGINMNSSFVIGQFRGFPFININAENDKEYLYSVLNTNEIPSGIIQFTFFDSLGIPQCERLVYTENDNDRIRFKIESEKSIYRKREKAFFNIHSEDLKGNPILTNLSLSITNTKTVKKDERKGHIKSYFNLESDLKGFIENPGYYFNPDNEDRYGLLDILLLTHGWRRFVWKEVLEDQFPDIYFPAEAGFNIEGGLFDFYNQSKFKPGQVRLFIYENQFYYNELETDKNGSFQFQGIDIYDSTHIVLQAWREVDKSEKKKKNKPLKTKNDFAINIRNKAFAAITEENWPMFQKEEESFTDYLELNDFILKIDSSFEGKTILLDELLIEDKRLGNTPFDRPGKLHKEPTRRIVMDSLMDGNLGFPLFDIIRKNYPGISITGTPPDVRISMRGHRTVQGNNEPMILLDGLLVESDYMYYFPSTEIAFIDILTAGKAAIYGRDAMNGVIALYTRQDPVYSTKERRQGIINFIHPGYSRVREFYIPDYDIPDEKHIKPDYRRVLYWEPSLTTNDQGDINFSFYASDEIAEYRMEIEGMTYSGIPFTNEYYFRVE